MSLIREKLDETRRLIKWRDAVTVALSLATFAGVFLAVEVALDRLFLLDRSFRTGALIAFAGLGTILLLLGVGYAFRRISLLYAARVMESHQPALRQSLTTYVQMRLGDASGSEEARKMIESRLSSDLLHVDFGVEVRRKLTRLAIASAGTLGVCIGIAAAVTGSGFFTCFERVLWPGASIAPPTETRITKVVPGDRHILQSADLEVVAMISGKDPGEARLYLVRDEGSWFTVSMTRDRDVWKAMIPGGQESARYFIAAGDSRSDIYRISVHPPPVMTNVTSHVSLPSYARTSMKPVSGGDIEAIPQTSVIMTATPNRKFRTADLVFDGGQRVPFKLAGSGKAQASFTIIKSDSYQFDLVDEHGLRNPRPQRFRIEVRPDRPPEVEIIQPAPVVEALPDQEIEILVNVTDDFGIELLELVTKRRGVEARRTILEIDPALGSRQSFKIKPADIDLTPPSSVLYFLEARDNSPAVQVTRSGIHVVHVRRRPTDALAAFDDLEKSLGALASDPELNRRLDLAPEGTTAKERDAEVNRGERELAKLQAALARMAKELGLPEMADLARAREDLKTLARELAELERHTQELPNRGLEKREALARKLEAKARELQRRAQAAAARLDRLSKEPDQPFARTQALKAAAESTEFASRLLEVAARAIKDGETEMALSPEATARASVGKALELVDRLMESSLSEEAREKAEALAKEQKKIREQTEELAAKSDADGRQRRSKAADSMKDAQRALEQGKPGAAADAAEEAKEQLEPEEPETEEEEAAREASEEQKQALIQFLSSARDEQNRILAATLELDGRRERGALKGPEAARLRDLGKREHVLSAKFQDARTEVEKDLANVFLWVMDTLRQDLTELGDLLEVKARTDQEVRAWQEEVVRRISELIEALQKKPKGGGKGGGGGGKPPRVDLENQLKLIITLQTGLRARTQSLHDRLAAAREADPLFPMRISGLLDQQEELRLQVEALMKALKEKEE